MKPIKGCLQDEVWNHWKKVEKIHDGVVDWRWDIRSPLPNNLQWFLTEIEEKDLPKIYIISSDDWKTLTQSFRFLEVVDALEKNVNDEKIIDIKAKRAIYQRDINGLDRKLVLVCPTTEGNFTIIEGNKRAVALQSIGKLVGTQIYLGVSSQIQNYKWARYSQ